MHPGTHAALRWQTSIALGHAVLQLDGTAHRVHYTAEFNKDAVAGPLDDAAVR